MYCNRCWEVHLGCFVVFHNLRNKGTAAVTGTVSFVPIRFLSVHFKDSLGTLWKSTAPVTAAVPVFLRWS